MQCPSCQSKLASINFRNIHILECVTCKGRWFDRDELQKAKDNSDEDLRWLDFNPFGKEASQYRVEGEHQLCPKCDVKMLSLTYSKSDVIIDKCAECRGIWLHHGEFEKIIQYLENVVTTESASEYVKDTFKQFLNISLGSEHLMHELKDFLVILKLLELRLGVEHPNITKASHKIYQYLPFL